MEGQLPYELSNPRYPSDHDPIYEKLQLEHEKMQERDRERAHEIRKLELQLQLAQLRNATPTPNLALIFNIMSFQIAMLVIPTLTDKKDYSQWCHHVYRAAHSNGFHRYLDGTMPRPNPTDIDATETYTRETVIITAAISSRLDYRILGMLEHIGKIPAPRALWTELEQLCRINGPQNIDEAATVLSELSTTRFSEADDINNWIAWIRKRYIALLDMNIAISEAIVCQFMLRALPTSFSSVVSTLQGLPDDEWNITSFASHIRLYCSQCANGVPYPPEDPLAVSEVTAQHACVSSPVLGLNSTDFIYATESATDNEPNEETMDAEIEAPRSPGQSDTPFIFRSSSHGEISRAELVNIDHSRRLTFESSKEIKEVWTFDGFELKENLLRGIYASNFEKPSAIQRRAILPVAEGRDVIAQGQSGTGKITAFSISILQFIDTSLPETQALVLSPTRELATQTQSVILGLGNYMNVKCHACIARHIWHPGRVSELIRHHNLHTRNIKMLVLDEADELLGQGFKDQIYDIYQYLLPSTQVAVFSSTLPYDTLETTTKFMTDPTLILLGRDELALEGIKQFFVAVEKEDWKFDTLCDLYDTLIITQAVEWLTEKMRAAGFTVTPLHGGMIQEERDAIMGCVRKGWRQVGARARLKSALMCTLSLSCVRVLITTDVWARGIDAEQMSLVINYDLPSNRENYIHRIGRAGCFGRKGLAINLVTIDDVRILRDIEQFYGTAMASK
ncbi:unnamed protein product [Rhizoctonia solani]|uniref:RNA helicase n=1 Tax=Rhizoctonia solani TaxID=456999 RepID=A0A8H3BHV4_9AGAM|nr:unnamed protein product [Rhizoctonia solani]